MVLQYVSMLWPHYQSLVVSSSGETLEYNREGGMKQEIIPLNCALWSAVAMVIMIG